MDYGVYCIIEVSKKGNKQKLSEYSNKESKMYKNIEECVGRRDTDKWQPCTGESGRQRKYVWTEIS